MSENKCWRCGGSGRICEEHEDGTTFMVDCPDCDGGGYKHAGVDPRQLRKEGYYDKSDPF